MTPSSTRPWIIAHRGVSIEAPENTLKGFTLAIDQGADFLELDIHLSADEQLVVIHDDTVDRTTNGTGRVNQLSLKELQLLDAGCWMGPTHCGERIPTLNEVLELTNSRTGLVIELKHGSDQYPGIERLLVNTIEEVNRLNDIIVISSRSEAIRIINEAHPDIMTLDFRHQPISCREWSDQTPILAAGKRFVFAKPDEVEIARIRHLHHLGFRVLSTIADENLSQKTVQKLVDSHVDGIFTDHTLTLKRLLEKCETSGLH
jgi:glycerophosphoryl diester phosphodiesterase